MSDPEMFDGIKSVRKNNSLSVVRASLTTPEVSYLVSQPDLEDRAIFLNP